MIQRTARDYEVSLWTLQDSFIAILKPYGLEYKGQIQSGKITDKDDGTQTFTFTIPMYLYQDDKRIENPGWYNVKTGNLLVNMRKVKVVFNKEAEQLNNRKIYEFLIVKVKEKHENDEMFCDVECEGLAFHQLGKIGYKISLSADDFYDDDYNWALNGIWVDSYGIEHTTQPLATLNYWNDKVFSTVDNWTYELQMNWDSHSLYQFEKTGIDNDYVVTNDVIAVMKTRESNKLYEDDFVDSWKNDENGNLIPAHVTAAREKARVGIEVSESNIYNITQTLAETFGVFCKYIYEHDANLHIINRKVVYYNNFLNESNGLMDLNYKYQTSSIYRQIDSTDLVTKLFVKGVENTGSEAGITSIINVPANKSQEDYILNFDYLYKIGGITEEQYNKVNEYIEKIRKINERITPLSAKIISLQAQLPKLQAELTTRTNAISEDTQQIFTNGELLNAITNNTEVLSITKSNPQTAVLIKDTGKSYNSYYVKITQKGVYGESIHLYKNYNYAQAQLLDEIFTGQVDYDESGNVIKISNLYVDETDSKTVYLIYDYRPALYYERIQAMWESRLAQDTARKQELEYTLAKINYNLYGLDHEYSMENVDISDIKDANIYNKYQAILKQKENLIKEFNLIMGPAIRQGYWQPEDYTDYGDKYSDSIRIGPDYIGKNNASLSSSNNVSFSWDNELFDGEQQLYYQYSSAQNKIAYPCINLEKHPQIIQLIQNNMDKNICFYYKNRTSMEDSPYARERPAVIEAPKYLYLIKDLYNLNLETGEKTLNSIIEQQYDNFQQNYPNCLGKLRQEWTDQSYKVGYTTFYWQIKIPNSQIWYNVTDYQEDITKNYGEQGKYTQYVIDEFFPYIQFTNNPDYPQEIQLFQTSSMTFQGCQFRLIIKNNKGINLNNGNEWYNGIAIQPTQVKLLNNEIEYIPLEAHKSRALYYEYTNNFSNLPLTFIATDSGLLDETATYELQYIRDTTGNNLSLTSWVNNNDILINEWTTIGMLSQQDVELSSNKDIYITGITREDDGSINYILKFNLNKLNFNIASDEWRFRLLIKNAQDYINDSELQVTSALARIYVSDACPYYSHADISKTYVDLTQSCKLQLKVYYDLPAARFATNGISIQDRYKVEQFEWKKIDRTDINANAETVILGTTSDASNNITVSSSIIPDMDLQKYCISLTIESTSGNINTSIINKIIENWDGFGVYPIITNKSNQPMKVPNNFNSLFTFDGYCPVMITSALQPSFTYPVQSIQNNITSDTYLFSISGTNITEYEWTIKLANNTTYYLNKNNLTVTASNNTYIASMQNNTTVKLHITIPRINSEASSSDYNNQFLDAIFNSGAEIYCTIWNESNRYTSQQISDSLTQSNSCYLQVQSLLAIGGLSAEEPTVKYWWPTYNAAKTALTAFELTFGIGIQNIFRQTIQDLENSFTVTVERSGVVDFQMYNIRDQEDAMIDNLEFSADQTSDQVTAQIIKGSSGQIEGENISYVLKTLVVTPNETVLTNWSEIIKPGALPPSNNNDKKFGYFYKIIITSSDTRLLNTEQVFYVKIIIRQSPPEFLPGDQKWKPISGYPAGEYETDDNVKLKLTYKSASIGHQGKTAFLVPGHYEVEGNPTIFLNNFGFDNNSVEYYYWKLNFWKAHASTQDHYSYVLGWEYNGEEEVRDLAQRAKSSIIIPKNGYTSSSVESVEENMPEEDKNGLYWIIYKAIYTNAGSGTFNGRLDPSVHCPLNTYSMVASMNELRTVMYSLPNGVLDAYRKRDNTTYVLMSTGLHRNLYLQATNQWGSTRTKTWQATIENNVINNNQSLIYLWDDTDSSYGYEILNQGYIRN